MGHVEGESGCDRVHVKSMTERFPAGAENCDMSFALLGDAGGSMKRWELRTGITDWVYYGITMDLLDLLWVYRDLVWFSVVYREL